MKTELFMNRRDTPLTKLAKTNERRPSLMTQKSAQLQNQRMKRKYYE